MSDPVANNDSYIVAANVPIFEAVTDNDDDGDPIPLPDDLRFHDDGFSINLVSQPEHGTLVIWEPFGFLGIPPGGFVYNPDKDYVGLDSFTYQFIRDDGTVLSTATVQLNVIGHASGASFNFRTGDAYIDSLLGAGIWLTSGSPNNPPGPIFFSFPQDAGELIGFIPPLPDHPAFAYHWALDSITTKPHTLSEAALFGKVSFE